MTRHTILFASTTLLVLAGAACTGGSDSVEVPGADTTAVVTDPSSATTAPDTEPPIPTELPTPTPAPTEPPATAAPLSTEAAPPQAGPVPQGDPVPAPETTAGRNPDFLRQGDEGPRIGLIQFKLVALGYLPTGGDTDVFDGATNSAVLSFQGDYGLIVDGIIGPETERAISAAAESINPEQ
jgi:peptidoglycan hydrolase-like protein with peptidoglycan-binding domain